MTRPADDRPSPAVESDVHCTANPALPATAWCTSCHLPFNGRFLGVRDDGRAICFGCAQQDGVSLRSETRTDVDPVLESGWRQTFLDVVTRPWQTFAGEYHGPIGPAVRQGLVWALLGYAMTMGWVWLLARDAFLEMLTESAPEGVEFEGDTLPMLVWLALPVLAVLRQAVGTLALHLGLRLSGAPSDDFGEHARLFGLTAVGLLLCAVPFVGPFLALVAWMTGTLAWVRQRYAMSTARAMLALIPALLVVTALDPLGTL